MKPRHVGRLRLCLIVCFTVAAGCFVNIPLASPGHGIALVLSGGGARGLAQIGTIKALDEAGLKPDVIVATSMGAIIGGLYAAGYCPDSIAHFASSFDWSRIYANSASRKQLLVSQKDDEETYLYELRFDSTFKPIIPQSISEGQSFFSALVPKLAAAQCRAKMNFDSLTIPLRIVCTDIVSGRKIVFSKGDLSSAIRASCSFPLVFSPVNSDSMLLVDGGLSSNIPVESVIDEFPGYCVIAVDVTSPMWEKKDLNSPVRLVEQIVGIGHSKEKNLERALARILVTPDCSGFLNSDFAKADTLIARGYRATVARLPAIRQAIDSLGYPLRDAQRTAFYPPFCFPDAGPGIATSLKANLSSVNPSDGIFPDRFKSLVYETFNAHGNAFARITSITRRDSCTVVRTDPGIIRGFLFRGNYCTRRSTIASALSIKAGDTLSPKSVSRAISSLYATDLFKNVDLIVDSAGIVTILVREKEYWLAQIGARFDDYHLIEGYVQPGYENLFGIGLVASLHLQYGLMREKYAFELVDNHVISQEFANRIQAQVYLSRESIIKRTETPDSSGSGITQVTLDQQTLGKGGALGLAGIQLGKSMMLDGGIRIEKFQLYQSKTFRNPFGGFMGGLQYLMARLTIDNLDKFPFPEKGQKDYISIGGAHNIIGGTESFLKVDGSFSQYFTIANGHTFSPQFQFVWADDSLPDVERVYLGGVVAEEKYREIGVYNYMPFFGLRPRALPGDVALLFRAQYRATIQRGLYFFATVDWGYSWQWDRRWLLSTGSARDLWNEFRDRAPVGMGLGLAYESLIGPIRFSWGRLLRNNFATGFNVLSENLFYLSIGHDF
jgi:predicted acylesterase/phospholipase RssA